MRVESPAPRLSSEPMGRSAIPWLRIAIAPDYAIVNYIEHEFNHHHSSLNIRNEYVDDLKPASVQETRPGTASIW